MFFCFFLFFILSSQNRTYFTMITLGHHTQPDLAGMFVVLSIITFLSKVTLCKSCLSRCNWFVVWPRMTSEFFYPLSHLLRNEKAVGQISLFLRIAIINGYCLYRSAMLSYTPIVVQNRGLKVTPSWFSALSKYRDEMSSESLSTIRDDWDVRFE